MSPNSLKQMVACGFVDAIIITAFPTHFTIMCLLETPNITQYLTYNDRKGNTKHFHTAKSLYAKIDEILNWPVNPETLKTLDASCIRLNLCSNDNQLKLPI